MKLSFKISVIIGVSSLIASSVAIVFCYSTVSDTVQKHIVTEQRESVSENIDKIDRFLYERQSEIQDAAAASQLSEDIRNGPTTNSMVVLKQEATDGDWNGFAILDLKGHTIAASDNKDLGTAFLGLSPDFPAIYARAKVGQGQLAYSDVIRLHDDIDPTLVMFTPIYDAQSHMVGVLAGEVSWKSIIEILKRIGAADVTLTNRSGLEIGTNQDDGKSEVLTSNWSNRPLFTKAKAETAGSAITPGLDDIKDTVLASYVKEAGYRGYSGNGWYLLATTPTGQAFAPARNIALQLAAILGIVLLVNLGLIAYFMSRHVSRPLRRLSEAARKFSGGDWNQRLAISSNDEIGELATALNTMGSQIGISHQQISLEKARLESSIQGLPLGFILTDKRNNIVNINPVMRKLVGLKTNTTIPDALKDTKQLELLQDVLERCDKSFNSGKVLRVAESLIDDRYYRFFVAPVMAGSDTIGAVALLEDITEAKVAERSKDEFFSIASHELRTPLTAIRGNTSMIKDYYPELLKDPSLNDMIGDIHDSSMRLIEIVNDFLDTSRLEQGKMKFNLEALAIEPIIEHVIYELDALSRERHIYLRMTSDLGTLPLVYADKDRVKQVVYNLVGNAMKFIKTGGVTISTVVEEHRLKVLISDTGQGISPQNQRLLFHKFQQATTNMLTRDTTRGTGLGLYISKLLVGKMGGTVTLEHSEVGKGSTFSFTLPLAHASEKHAPGEH